MTIFHRTYIFLIININATFVIFGRNRMTLAVVVTNAWPLEFRMNGNSLFSGILLLNSNDGIYLLAFTCLELRRDLAIHSENRNYGRRLLGMHLPHVPAVVLWILSVRILSPKSDRPVFRHIIHSAEGRRGSKRHFSFIFLSSSLHSVLTFDTTLGYIGVRETHSRGNEEQYRSPTYFRDLNPSYI